MKKKKKTAVILISVFFLISCYLYYENNFLEISRLNISDVKIQGSFEGFKIAHISDYHNTKSKKLNEDLVESIKEEAPDIIAITGDLIDSRKTDIESALRFIDSIKDIAPVYFVPGNHEAGIDRYEELKAALTEAGVTVLDNQAALIDKGGRQINIAGINDPLMAHEPMADDLSVADSELDSLSYDDELFTVLLSHRPELMDTYAEHRIDLVLSGHAHGGQIVIPFIGGMIAPNQGLFPEYTEGTYRKEATCMVVSRGIGNSIAPFRINNRPELVIITLKHKQN